MKKSNIYLYILILLVSFVACTSEKTFTDLDKVFGQEKLLISGQIVNQKASIIVSKSFFPKKGGNSLDGKTTDPQLWIITPENNKIPMTSKDNILFELEFPFIENKLYRIGAIADGFDYIESEEIPIFIKPQVDSIQFIDFDEKNKKLTVFLKDIETEKNYYFLSLYTNQNQFGEQFSTGVTHNLIGNEELVLKCYSTYLFTDDCFNLNSIMLEYIIPNKSLNIYGPTTTIIDTIILEVGKVNEEFYENNGIERDKEFTIDENQPKIYNFNVEQNHGFIYSVSLIDFIIKT